MSEKIRTMNLEVDGNLQYIIGFEDNVGEATKLVRKHHESGTAWLEHPSAPATKTLGGTVIFAEPIPVASNE